MKISGSADFLHLWKIQWHHGQWCSICKFPMTKSAIYSWIDQLSDKTRKTEITHLPLETVLCDGTELPAEDDAAPALLVDEAAAFPESLDCCVRGIKLGFKLGCIASSVDGRKQKIVMSNNAMQSIIICTILVCFRYAPCSVKLNSGGNSFPFGSLWLHSLSSLKNGWAHACNGEIRAFGVYSNSLDTRAIASGGVRDRNTYEGNKKHKIH